MFSIACRKFWGAAIATLALAGCGGGGSSTPPPSLMINSDSGTQRAATGTWTSCFMRAGANVREDWIISGTSLTLNSYSGASSGVYPCTGGTLNAANSGSGTLTVAASMGMSGGWVNGQPAVVVPAPAKASGIGTLVANPSATIVTFSGTIGSGATVKMKLALFVDDSAAQYRLYLGSTSAGGACVDASGNPVCLWAGDPYFSSFGAPTAGAAPTISSFSPTTGASGSSVVITGTNFSTTPANNTVKFNGVAATVTAATATQLTVTVPAAATSGTISVTTATGTVTSTTAFTVTAAAPTLTFTNGNAIPELTGVPVMPASWTAANAATTPSFNVTVPVDSDTAGIFMMWGTYSGTTFTVKGSGNVALTPGAAQSGTVTITPFSGATTPVGSTYSLQILLCNTAGTCDFANLGNVALYMESATAPGTYSKNTWSGGVAGMGSAISTETGVTIPLMTVN